MSEKPPEGPWKVGAVEGVPSALEITNSKGVVICDNVCYYPHPVDKANMELIAAAPEMLKALIFARTQLTALGKKNIRVDEAIAKATGKSK